MSEILVNGELYDVRVLETETDLIILVDDEPFSIALGNETHDALGRFSSKAGSAVKKVAKGATKGVVGSAIAGAGFGAIGGAVKGAFDKSEGTAATRIKRGLIKGAINGAKKNAVRTLVKNTLDMGAEHAGNYGWAVRTIGGLSIAVVGKKKNFGLEPDDFRKIGKEMFSAGFSELVTATLEYEEPVYLEEGNFKTTLAQLADMVANFLDTSEEEYMGMEEGAGLEELGFVEKEGVWYIHREDAEELLASLLAYGEKKLETYENETIKLFNPNHDEKGRFTVRIGGRAIFTGPKRQPFELAGNEYARAAFKVAGVGATTYKVLDAIQSKVTDTKIQQRLQFGKNVAGTTALAAGGIGGFLKAGVYGKASVGNLAKMGKEIKTEVTYKGANKKPVVDRVIDTFNYGRRAFGYAGLSALGAVGGITASMLLYRAFGGKGKVSDGLYDNLNRAGQYASQVMGEGWMSRMAGMFGYNLEERHPLLGLFDNSEVLEGLFTFWTVLDAYAEDGEGFSLDDFSLTPEETINLHETLTHFIMGHLEDQDKTKLTLYEEDTIRLFNPNHDKLGRFATAAQVGGAVTTIIGSSVNTSYKVDFQKKLKEKYGSSNVSEDKMDALKTELKDQKVFSKKIAGKEFSMTWGTYEKLGQRIAFAGMSSVLLGQGLGLYSDFKRSNDEYEDFKQRQQNSKDKYESWQNERRKSYQQRAQEARERAEREWKTREEARAKQSSNTTNWPKGATEEDFKAMYKKIAKKYHPDINKSPQAEEIMKAANQAKDKRDWKGMEDMFIHLEAVLETADHEMVEFILEVLETFLSSDMEYLTIPDDGSGDWVVDGETGLAVLDKITAQYVYDLLKAGEELNDRGETEPTEE